MNAPAHRARSLKLACLILFLTFAIVSVATRQQRADGGAQASALTNNAIASAADNKAPEMHPVRIKRVGLGQRIHFGLGAIDEESDDVRIEVVQKPASAKYNEKTLTVDWTPKPTDDPKGMFVIRITEYPLDKTRRPRELTKFFAIPVEAKPVQILELPPAPLEVDTLVSVIDPARLVAANERWSIVRLFDRIAGIETTKQVKQENNIQPTTGEALFRDALKNLAVLHRNEEIDPDSPKFNPEWKAENWRLIAVRPRLNKKTFELRLVYFNVVAPEPVYLMPRLRIVRGADAKRPEELRHKNNKEFARLLHNAFFEGENLKPFVAGDKKKYGEALAELITSVVGYSDPEDPLMQANFAAMPHNARLGGDNKYDEKGRYLSGDGWALGAMKVGTVERDGKKVLAFISPFIDGFATSIKPNADGTAYKPVPAPRFTPGSKDFASGWDRLVDEDDHGNVAIPDIGDGGAVKGSNIDSASFSREHKMKFMVAETSLRDPRRRLFEERGMTCIQCHVRNFDEGDYLNPVNDPKQAAKVGATRDIERVFFVIVPTLKDGRTEYIRREEDEQVGNLKGVLRDYLGIKVNLNSPLAAEWPHDTRRGRS
ncbi:MAG: hypothetical protein H7Y30_13415 [Pyrinomonadaceae bacterium]|nr:hypothetical protein [Pyrinomonadaceae bacterium]